MSEEFDCGCMAIITGIAAIGIGVLIYSETAAHPWIDSGKYNITMQQEKAQYTQSEDEETCWLNLHNRKPVVQIYDKGCNNSADRIWFNRTKMLTRDQLEDVDYNTDKLDDLLERARDLAKKIEGNVSIMKKKRIEEVLDKQKKEINRYMEKVIPTEAEKTKYRIE